MLQQCERFRRRQPYKSKSPLRAANFSPAALAGVMATLNPLFGLDTHRQTRNPFQYGFKLHF